ncbi:hypothetical protein KDA_64280 [Dictyobacter alpinus]|uniref:Uncharacterized protein n=1 Tax=Dictyobacter alpinus TaxID=2014873 RepID=A0A402BHQ5_9CHLR|nr:hypothetical protein KDA_64280 [Dictyobacter alpinus]
MTGRENNSRIIIPIFLCFYNTFIWNDFLLQLPTYYFYNSSIIAYFQLKNPLYEI